VATFAKDYPSHIDSIRAARRDLTAFLRRCGCPPEDRYDICLAAAEAIANAIEHGHVPGGDVAVECQCDGDVTVTIRDEGGGMRAKTWQRVFVKAAVGGYGLLLMRGLMDDVRLDVDEDFGATVVMKKRCDRAPA
jgi:anti-sigma regulatory factor (Ser/Thr protein kinase)